MKNWELCPKCNGEGRQSPTGINCIGEVCSLCNGTMVISVFTGLPPARAHAQTKASTNITLASMDDVPFTYTNSLT